MKYPSELASMHSDVCVIGGSMSGACAAVIVAKGT